MIGMHRGRKWFFVGRPGSALGNFHLILGCPVDPLYAEGEHLVRSFVALCLLMMGFALTVGVSFAQQVVVPLKTVFHGLQKLAASDFDGKCDINSGDEMEELGNGITQLLEEMREIG